MTGKGRGGKMKIMATLAENIYKTTKVFGPKWDKPKVCALPCIRYLLACAISIAPLDSRVSSPISMQWARFRAAERDHMINWQKWREAEAAQRAKDERAAAAAGIQAPQSVGSAAKADANGSSPSQ
eukprot:scaffold220936_cov39-Tisochrysis_lutea.AAC.1